MIINEPRWGDRVAVDGFSVIGLLVDWSDDKTYMTVAFPSGKETEVLSEYVRAIK